MKKSKFTEEQIAFALHQVDTGTAVEEVCRKVGISQATFYAWKKKYAGLGVSELRRLKQLEEENRKLKQLVADLSLDKVMLQDVLKKNVWSAPHLQGSRSNDETVCVNVSGLLQVGCGCSQAMMRCARSVPIKLATSL